MEVRVHKGWKLGANGLPTGTFWHFKDEAITAALDAGEDPFFDKMHRSGEQIHEFMATPNWTSKMLDDHLRSGTSYGEFLVAAGRVIVDQEE